MRQFRFWNILTLSLGIFFIGCAAKSKILPLHDEVLRFHLPYDLTYLRSTEALERVEGWELESTEKERGIIQVRNINYSSFDDADKRIATLWVKRIGPRETAVQLAPQSQTTLGGGELLERVSQYLDQELNK